MAATRKEDIQYLLDNIVNLPEKNVVFLIQNFLLECFSSETYFEWQLVGKLMDLSEPDRETLTKSLNDAVKKNKQKIAGLSVSDWIKKYLAKYDGVARNPNTFFEYCSREPEIRKLGKQDQLKLMRLFRMYDYLLVEPIFDLEYPVENILRFPMRLDSTPSEISAQVQTAQSGFKSVSQRTISEKLPVRELLRKYPAAGEQTVTSGQLKIRNFDRPVRSSIKNWIYDYTSQLGRERHDSMQRMKYLFSSANGKNLASPDREKLGIILKSFDENVPLAIDASRNEIIFDQPAPQSRGATEKREINQGPAFPSLAAAHDPSKPDLSPRPQQSFIKPYERISDPQKPSSPSTNPQTPPAAVNQNKIQNTKYQYINPFPKPETHESQFPEKRGNISNVRFNEGLPRKPIGPRNSSTPPARRQRRKIIEPISSPEPKIEGNIVDLKGEK